MKAYIKRLFKLDRHFVISYYFTLENESGELAGGYGNLGAITKKGTYINLSDLINSIYEKNNWKSFVPITITEVSEQEQKEYLS